MTERVVHESLFVSLAEMLAAQHQISVQNQIRLSEVARWADEWDRARSLLNAEVDKRHARVETLETESAGLRMQLADLRKERDEDRVAHGRALEAQRVFYETQVDALKAAHAEELRKARARKVTVKVDASQAIAQIDDMTKKLEKRVTRRRRGR